MTREVSAGFHDDLPWVKSSHSTSDGPECVEVAATADTVYIRDSKDGSHTLAFTPTAWRAFIAFAARRR